MRSTHFVAGLLLSLCPLSAQTPYQLRHSLFSTSEAPPEEAFHGWSVSAGESYFVVGAPDESTFSDEAGAVKVYDPQNGALLHRVLRPDPSSWGFGFAVAVSGTRMVVGAYRHTSAGNEAGRAYVYDLASANPTVPILTLDNPTPEDEDDYGRQVAISGNYVVIGAERDRAAEGRAGIAYVYDLSSATPSVPKVVLNNPTPEWDDYFGASVAIDGSRVVIGAPSDRSNSNAGAAYVYDLAGQTPDVPTTTLYSPTLTSFGYVAISGSLVVVGGPSDSTGPKGRGRAYVFDLAGPNPTIPITPLNNPTLGDFTNFGIDVAIAGTKVVIAQPGSFGAPPTAAYVYDVVGATPQDPIAVLTHPASGTTQEESFGQSVSIVGNRVLVGVPKDDTGNEDAGCAYVYDLGSATPTTPAFALINRSPSTENAFGSTISIFGDRLAISAPGDRSGAGYGRTYLYRLDGLTPYQPVSIFPGAGGAVKVTSDRLILRRTAGIHVYSWDNANSFTPGPLLQSPQDYYSMFGSCFSISGNTLIAGHADRYDNTGAAGAAHIYNLAGPSPTTPILTLLNPEPQHSDRFGGAVDISGNIAVVGAYWDNTPTASEAGSAYVYDLGSATPTVPIVKLPNPTPANSDNFGRSVAISGNVVVVSAYEDDTAAANAGRVYVYDLNSATPAVPVLDFSKPNPAASDRFGRSLSLVGRKLAVGANFSPSGVSFAGSTYIYDLDSATPTIPIAIIDNPEPDASDSFGGVVALSETRVVIGAPDDDRIAYNQGAAYVYALSQGITEQPTLGSPATGSKWMAYIGVSFLLPEAALPGSVTLSFDDGTTPRTLVLAGSMESSGLHNLTFAAFNPLSSLDVTSGPSIPDGTYTVTLSYRDSDGNPAATTVSTNVLIDTVSPALSGVFTQTVLFAPQGGDVALPSYLSQVTATDSSGITSLIQTPVAGSLMPEGTHEVVFTAIDGVGNLSEMTLNVTVLVSGTTRLVMSGEAVPRAETDLRIPEGSTWESFGIPSIFAQGQRAGWLATVKFSARGKFSGIFSGSLEHPELRLKTGDPATDADGADISSVFFKAFRDPVFGTDSFAVCATVQGSGVRATNDTGIWFGSGNSLRQIAREGSQLAGSGEAVLKKIDSLAITADDTVFFTGSLSGPAVGRMGLWSYRADTGVKLLLQQGWLFDDGEFGSLIRSFQVLNGVKGSPGHGRYAENEEAIDVRIIMDYGVTAIVTVGASDGLDVRLLKGKKLSSGAVLGSLGVPSTGAGGGAPSAIVKLQPGTNPEIDKSNDVALLDLHTGDLFAQEGQEAPGAIPAVFKSFLDPVKDSSSDEQSHAFMATLSGTQKTTDSGIWKQNSEGVSLVAREGGDAVGALGARWKTFISLSTIHRRGPLFTAMLSSGAEKVSAANSRGFWATNSSGQLELVARTGDPIGGKQVTKFSALEAVTGSAGQRRAWADGDPSARVIYRVNFSDRTSAIISTAIP